MLHELAVYHISWCTLWAKVYTKYMCVQPSNLISVLFQHTVRICICMYCLWVLSNGFLNPLLKCSKKMIQVLVPEPSRMNGAMVPVSPAENVKMTLKSGKVPEDLRQSKSGSL